MTDYQRSTMRTGVTIVGDGSDTVNPALGVANAIQTNLGTAGCAYNENESTNR